MTATITEVKNENGDHVYGGPTNLQIEPGDKLKCQIMVPDVKLANSVCNEFRLTAQELEYSSTTPPAGSVNASKIDHNDPDSPWLSDDYVEVPSDHTAENGWLVVYVKIGGTWKFAHNLEVLIALPVPPE